MDKDLGSWWEVFSKKRLSIMYTLIKKRKVTLPLGFFNMIRKSFVYLLDIVKVSVHCCIIIYSQDNLNLMIPLFLTSILDHISC